MIMDCDRFGGENKNQLIESKKNIIFNYKNEIINFKNNDYEKINI